MPLGAAKAALLGAAGSGAPLTAFGGIISQYETGGTTYRVHTFRGSGKFVVSSGAADVDYLILAGGGSGGGVGTNYTAGGGGGAGGLTSGTGVAASAGSYTITVGTGGQFATTHVAAYDGNDSVALGITADGGGKGGINPNGAGGAGGSGIAYISYKYR